MEPRERVIVALDRSDRDSILRLVDSLSGSVGVFKIGLQAFVSNGPSIVREVIDRGEKVFLDLKFHDIPNTASHAVKEAAALGASIVNVHAAGGQTMMKACREAAPSTIVLAVTILTSLDAGDLEEIGYSGSAESNVVRLARLTKQAGLDGVVASPREIAAIRDACGEQFVILTPGIRSSDDSAGDQRRTMTAREAVAAGATYIVVGRPITGAADPRAAALRILEEM